jgi:hypothetical protein
MANSVLDWRELLVLRFHHFYSSSLSIQRFKFSSSCYLFFMPLCLNYMLHNNMDFNFSSASIYAMQISLKSIWRCDFFSLFIKIYFCFLKSTLLPLGKYNSTQTMLVYLCTLTYKYLVVEKCNNFSIFFIPVPYHTSTWCQILLYSKHFSSKLIYLTLTHHI